MEEAERSHHQLLILQQQVGVFSWLQVQDSPWRRLGKRLTSVQARKVPEFFWGALVPRGDQLVDGVGEEELGVGQLQAPPEEAPQSQGPVNINGRFAGIGAALEAERAQQSRKSKNVVAVKVSDENLGNSGCGMEQEKTKTGKDRKINTETTQK